MTDYILQPHLRIASTRVRYSDNTGMSEPSYSGDYRTAARGGDRIGGQMEFSPVGGGSSVDRSCLVAFLARIQNRQGRFYSTPAENTLVRKGSFPTGELLANVAFDATTGWTSSTGEATVTATEKQLCVTRTGVGADLTIRHAGVTTVTGAAYVARVFMYAGRGAMDYRLRLGTTAGGNEITATAADVTSQGMLTLTGIASSTITHFSILDGNSSRSINHYQDIAYLSLSRCPQVNGASQTGSALVIDGLPASTAGAILPGQWFEVITTRGSELKICTAPVDGDSSGGGYLRFSPPLRGTPADDSPIILHQPMGYFMNLSDLDWMTEPGLFTRASLDIVEA